jgi:hypothetical protein
MPLDGKCRDSIIDYLGYNLINSIDFIAKAPIEVSVSGFAKSLISGFKKDATDIGNTIEYCSS